MRNRLVLTSLFIWKGFDIIKKIRKKILNETTSTCFNCRLRERCIEEDCVLFRIEKIIKKIKNKD